jgi:hypothetical protein
LSHSHKIAGLGFTYIIPPEYRTCRFHIDEGDEECVTVTTNIFNGPDQAAIKSNMSLLSHIVYILLHFNNIGSAYFVMELVILTILVFIHDLIVLVIVLMVIGF